MRLLIRGSKVQVLEGAQTERHLRIRKCLFFTEELSERNNLVKFQIKIVFLQDFSLRV